MSLPRKQSILARAFEQTYQRSIIDTDDARLSSIVFGFLGGDELKAKKSKTEEGAVELKHDKNLWNKIEGAIFFLPRLAKNIAKLFTEFMWNAAAEAILAGAKKVHAAAERYKEGKKVTPAMAFVYFSMIASASLIEGLSLIPRLIAKIGQSITSPLTGIKDTYNYVKTKTNSKILGGIAGFLRGLVSLALYTTIGMFALPAVAPLLGAKIAGGISTAMTWLANAPVLGTVISTIGAGFTTAVTAIASFLGIGVPSAIMATSAVVAGTSLLALPILAGLKVGLRKLFPFATRKLRVKEAQPEAAINTNELDSPSNKPSPENSQTDTLDTEDTHSLQIEGQTKEGELDTSPNQGFSSASALSALNTEESKSPRKNSKDHGLRVVVPSCAVPGEVSAPTLVVNPNAAPVANAAPVVNGNGLHPHAQAWVDKAHEFQAINVKKFGVINNEGCDKANNNNVNPNPVQPPVNPACAVPVANVAEVVQAKCGM